MGLITDSKTSVRQAGETILAIPTDGKRYDAVTIKVDKSQFPDVPDLDFVTMIVERSLDGGKTWEMLGSAQTSGKRVADFASITIKHLSKDGQPVPLDGDIRGRIVSKASFKGTIQVEKIDATPLVVEGV